MALNIEFKNQSKRARVSPGMTMVHSLLVCYRTLLLLALRLRCFRLSVVLWMDSFKWWKRRAICLASARRRSLSCSTAVAP
jgi:hypothetical protein